MLTFEKFTGINNVLPRERLAETELLEAVNVDIGLSGEISRRDGFTLIAEGCFKNLWQAEGFMLATQNGQLVAVDEEGATALLHPSTGDSRVWYCNLPDGRTVWSNGLQSGTTDGTTWRPLGIPLPESLGIPAAVGGELAPGAYRWGLSYVREEDGLEGGVVWSEPAEFPEGGVLLTGLPQRDGYAINVYLANGAEGYLAGVAPGASFSYLGKNSALVLPSRNDLGSPPPAGRLLSFWRGRLLMADGPLLLASRAGQWELFDFSKDFKQLGSDITLIQPVDDGIYVGTTSELAFLSGVEFSSLAYRQVLSGSVVLGSGVSVMGKHIGLGSGGAASGSAMIGIANGGIVAGLNGGQVIQMTDDRYRTEVQEVVSVFREHRGIPQYIAVPV